MTNHHLLADSLPLEECPRVYPVMSHQVLDCWAEVEPILNKSLRRTDQGFSAEDVLTRLQNQDMQLWWIPGYAVAITQINVLPQFKTLAVVHVAGEQMDLWFENLMSVLEEFGRGNDCKYAEEFGRPGWKKVGEKLGWKPVYQVMRKTL